MKETEKVLNNIREIIRKVAPEAEETIAYGIPTFKFMGRNLVHFAAYKHHIGFYPTPSGIEKFEAELKNYKKSKGAVQFPLNKPIPYDLIEKITRFRRDQEISKK